MYGAGFDGLGRIDACISAENQALIATHHGEPQSMFSMPPGKLRRKRPEYPYTPLYRRLNSGGPWFMFDKGGWDYGWGVIVGKTDLVNPSPINLPYGGHGGWTKELQPGVFLYAFES